MRRPIALQIRKGRIRGDYQCSCTGCPCASVNQCFYMKSDGRGPCRCCVKPNDFGQYHD